MFVYKTSEGDNVLETFLTGLEGEGGGGGQQEDGDEAEHAEASSDHAVIRSLGAGPFIRGRLIFNDVQNVLSLQLWLTSVAI
jgi:hypothetical protein